MNMPLNTTQDSSNPIDQARYNMIWQQIRPWNVSDEVVQDAMMEVRREWFVPPQYEAQAFVDRQLPLPCGENMLAPRIEARLMQDLQLQGDERVLEIGTGSGYMAALLAYRSKMVVTLEIHAPLVEMAEANLRRAGIKNVEVRLGNGAREEDLPEGEFDAILLSGSVPEIPSFLLDKLSARGRLIAIVGEEPCMRVTVVSRQAAEARSAPEGGFKITQPWDTTERRLAGFVEPSRFVF